MNETEQYQTILAIRTREHRFRQWQNDAFYRSGAPEAKRKDPADGWLSLNWSTMRPESEVAARFAHISSELCAAHARKQHHHIYYFRNAAGILTVITWERPSHDGIPRLTIEDETTEPPHVQPQP